VLAKIAEKKILDDELKKELNAAFEEFGKQFESVVKTAQLRTQNSELRTKALV
jgi:hypothetical protein